MSAATGQPPQDQASRLRAMVSSFYGPGVSYVTYVDRPRPQSPAATPALREPRAPSVPVVAITSGKGGVGKTSLSVNLAVALQASRIRTALVDADLGLANADLLCGISPTTRLDAVIAGADPAARRSLDQIAVNAPGGFRLVPGSAGVARMANLTAPQRTVLLDGLADLESQSDLILIDTGAGLGEGVTSFVSASDLALVVVTPEPTSIADAYALIKCVSRLASPPNLALVANMCRSEDEGFAVHARVASTAKRFLQMNLPLLGVVRRDDCVGQAVRSRTPCLLGTPRAKASRDIALVAEQLSAKLQVKGSAPKPSGEARGLWGRILGR